MGGGRGGVDAWGGWGAGVRAEVEGEWGESGLDVGGGGRGRGVGGGGERGGGGGGGGRGGVVGGGCG